MTTAMRVVDADVAAIDQAQLHLALASVSYMSGQMARSRAEAEAVLVEPGLPAPMYAAAALVAEGLSNQQVAMRMFLSRHTVDFHLRHIFRKLRIASRVALTRIALSCEGVPS